MTEGVLSQDEIDALLRQADTTSGSAPGAGPETGSPPLPESESRSEPVVAGGALGAGVGPSVVSPEEADAIGEIGNISMGTAATALSTLLGKKVEITTPRVQVVKMADIISESPRFYVTVEVEYTKGLTGLNLFILDTRDAAVIGDLMMGLPGTSEDIPLDEIRISAVGEAMNQMMGSAATAMSSMFRRRIDISPPQTRLWNVAEVAELPPGFNPEDEVVRVAFHLHVGDLVDSDFYQLLPVPLAKEMVTTLLNTMTASSPAAEETAAAAASPPASKLASVPGGTAVDARGGSGMAAGTSTMTMTFAGGGGSGGGQRQLIGLPGGGPGGPVEVRRAEFAQFDDVSDLRGLPMGHQNIQLLLDVPLQVTVELGRTKMSVKEVLELGKGAVIELERLAGEPVDVLVNGKLIAKGEVVVIDESFGVKITNIISPTERVEKLQ